MIKNEETEGSAPLEFLLSLCIGKMTLEKTHYKKLYDSVRAMQVDKKILLLLDVLDKKFIEQ